jgi:hypothetical protein
MHEFFSSKIGELYESKQGKKIIADYMKLIKEDNILRQQYNLYTQLDEGVSNVIKENKENATEYVNEMLNSFEGITRKQITESNNKLFWFLMNNNIITESENPWGMLLKENNILKEGKNKQDWVFTKTDPIFRSAEYLLYEGRKNLSFFIENKTSLANNLRLQETTLDEQKTPEDRIKDFNNKYQGQLTSEEMNLVRELIKSSKPQDVLVEYQKAITNSINELIKIAEDVELKDKYLQLKEQVLFEDYSNLEKAAKLFEIRQTIDQLKN